VVSGDHATPSILAGHGWQPVPALVASAYCGGDPSRASPSATASGGTLGLIPAHALMPVIMANALRFTKYGA
jgi:2,3-bisphosphoglycerate-independent phosphoglycerate mutase